MTDRLRFSRLAVALVAAGALASLSACGPADGANQAPLAERTINVAGDAPHVSRRVTDWLKKEARSEINARANAAAEALDKRILKIQIRDTRSRWGSCSEDARLSFSWRLMMAPENVLTYVVAHEVAHLVELNHSDRFWRLVDQLCPGNEPAKYWLKRHGASLHRFG